MSHANNFASSQPGQRPRTLNSFRHGQSGAMAIEYALLFIPFFALFYGIVSYGFVFTLVESFSSAAEGGARAAIAIDPTHYSDTSSYLNDGIVPVVRQTIGNQLAWMPNDIKTHVLGSNNEKIRIALNNNILSVTVAYPDYKTTPVMPLLRLPGVGEIPRVPDELTGTASISL